MPLSRKRKTSTCHRLWYTWQSASRRKRIYLFFLSEINVIGKICYQEFVFTGRFFFTGINTSKSLSKESLRSILIAENKFNVTVMTRFHNHNFFTKYHCNFECNVNYWPAFSSCTAKPVSTDCVCVHKSTEMYSPFWHALKFPRQDLTCHQTPPRGMMVLPPKSHLARQIDSLR